MASLDPLPKVWAGLPPELRPYVASLMNGAPMLWINGPKLEPRARNEEHPGRVWIGFDGSPEAVALVERVAWAGSDPRCLFIAGIGDEDGPAKAEAEKRGWPLTVIQAEQYGTGPNPNPAKTALLLAVLTDMAAQAGGHGFALAIQPFMREIEQIHPLAGFFRAYFPEWSYL
jgi:hypothetical protein